MYHLLFVLAVTVRPSLVAGYVVSCLLSNSITSCICEATIVLLSVLLRGGRLPHSRFLILQLVPSSARLTACVEANFVGQFFALCEGVTEPCMSGTAVYGPTQCTGPRLCCALPLYGGL